MLSLSLCSHLLLILPVFFIHCYPVSRCTLSRVQRDNGGVASMERSLLVWVRGKKVESWSSARFMDSILFRGGGFLWYHTTPTTDFILELWAVLQWHVFFLCTKLWNHKVIGFLHSWVNVWWQHALRWGIMELIMWPFKSQVCLFEWGSFMVCGKAKLLWANGDYAFQLFVGNTLFFFYEYTKPVLFSGSCIDW